MDKSTAGNDELSPLRELKKQKEMQENRAKKQDERHEEVDNPPTGGDNTGMETRIAILETRVGHIESDVKEIKSDLKDFRKDFDGFKMWIMGFIVTLMFLLAGALGTLVAKQIGFIK